MAESLMQHEPAATITVKATADVLGARFVNVSANRTGGGTSGLSSDMSNVVRVAMVSVIAGAAIGVAVEDIIENFLGRAHLGGIVTVESGAAIAAGDAVMSDDSGRVVPYVPGHTLLGVTAPSHKLGLAMTGVAGAGLQAEILLRP